MKTVSDKSFDEERALYGEQDIIVRNCRFGGPADGESAFKECGNVTAEDCFSTCAIHSGTIRSLKFQARK